jgi:eukaryotic-like serine/threonine-protein kinase
MSEPHDPLVGRVIDGRFTLQSVLGRGGMGVVYRAHQASLERAVALKLMSGVDPEREAEFQRRFFLEASTAAKLKHPNTITVFDYGSTQLDGERVFFIAMELLEGITLSQLLKDVGVLPVPRAVHIAAQICRSLREAHLAGVVHRDLKPGNVMLVKHDTDDVEGDFVKVLDFGLAKSRHGAAGAEGGITRAGTFMGSPRYVAPEQINGKVVDARADIYSFGCVFYRMLTGVVPFDGEQAIDILTKHIKEPVPPMSRHGVTHIPPVLEELTRRCLEKHPERRMPSLDGVLAMLRQLRQVSTGEVTGPVLRASLPPASTAADSGSIPRQPVLDPDDAEPTAVLVEKRPDATEQTWSMGDARPAPLRPLPVVKRPSPWRAIGLGLAIGLLLVCGLIVWRLSSLSRPSSAATSNATLPHTDPTTPATNVVVRIHSEPMGADVFEVVQGVATLVGVTPLEVSWAVHAGESMRRFRISKSGFVSAAADVDAPADPSPGHVLEVNAALRPLGK